MSELIAAVATGTVRSAIGIIRLSGDGAIDCVDRVFRARSRRKMADTQSNKLIYGGVYDKNGALLDTCMCTVSRAPHSYTGEDTAELQCHGSPAALGAALSELFENGARQALPGEFTKRAFLNGKLDLVGAEAVIDLIDAETVAAAKNASAQIAGAVTRKTDAVYSALLDIIAHFHAVVDWADEDIEDFEAKNYLQTLSSAENTLEKLLDTFDRGKLLRDGVKTAIVGLPNVGKSSLMNALLGFDRAIVTGAPGTTRDTVEDTCLVGDAKLRLIDTAGLRDAEDEAERMGVSRSYEAMESAGIVVAVIDASRELTPEDVEIAEKASVIVLNKSDLPGKVTLPPELTAIPSVSVSARTGEGIDRLCAALEALLPKSSDVPAGEILTNARQAGEVSAALNSLRPARAAIETGVTPDAALTELESALNSLARLTGKTLSADVTDRIFHRFCVGK